MQIQLQQTHHQSSLVLPKLSVEGEEGEQYFVDGS